MYVCSTYVIFYTEIEEITILSNRVRQINVQALFMVDDDTWPPEQLKTYTPLLLIYYQGNHNPKQVATMAKLMQRGNASSIASDQIGMTQHSNQGDYKVLHRILDGHTVTEMIEEILIPLENSQESCLILIEGGPDVGKTALLKEIAYRIRQNIRGGKLSWFLRILAKRESFTIESFPSSQLENFIIIP